MLLIIAKFYKLYLLHNGLNVVNPTTPSKLINLNSLRQNEIFLFTGTQTKYMILIFNIFIVNKMPFCVRRWLRHL